MTKRNRYTGGPDTEQLKQKLLLGLKQYQGDTDLLAEDMVELIAVARNEQNGFSAASSDLDRLHGFYSSCIGKRLELKSTALAGSRQKVRPAPCVIRQSWK